MEVIDSRRTIGGILLLFGSDCFMWNLFGLYLAVEYNKLKLF